MTRAEFEVRLFGVLKWVSVAFFVLICLFPLVYMVALSFKPIQDLLLDPARWWPSLEQIFNSNTYQQVLKPVEEGGQGFLVFIRNSLIVAVATVALTLAVMFSRIGLRQSLYGLIIVYLAATLPVALYMLRNYFNAIPYELEEAAMVDGLSRFGVIRKVTIPLAAPAIAAVGLYVFMIAWNEFLYALLFVLERRDLWTLSLGVQQLDNQEVPKTVLMAGSVIISIPVIILFFAAERFLREGLTAGGVKG